MEFIFGTLANDELKLAHHRAKRRGLQHDFELQPRDPQPGQAVTLTVRSSQELGLEQLACYYTRDGSEPSGRRGVADNGEVAAFESAEVVWDSLCWQYLTHWRATLPGQPDGTMMRYCIGGWREGSEEVFADWPDARAATESAALAFFSQEPISQDPAPGDPDSKTVFTYQVDTLKAPRWAENAVIYHLFIDRFHPGNGREWRQTEDLQDFCGGTLWGVRDKLDYLGDLGVTCIWLSPTWVSPSHHGYDAVDLGRVEPRLGGNEALRAVVEGAHERGMRILLDLACNHLSDQHPYFRDALADPHSPYRKWFHFDDSAVGYRAFFNVPAMPQLNLTNPAAREWMTSIAQRWLREFDVDGYRLDYASGPGPNFWSYFRPACKEAKADCFCFGEVVDAPDAVRRYLGRLDGCLDFQVSDALRRTFARGSWTIERYRRFLVRHLKYFPADFLMPSFLDNHDMDRFLFIAQGDKEALRRAAAAQLALPGPAIIYYGTEVGLGQTVSTRETGLHASRTLMPWGAEQDTELLEYYRRLIRKRRN